MEQTVQETLAQVVAKETWSSDDYQSLLRLLTTERHGHDRLRSALAELEAAHPQPRGAAALKIGLARYLLGRYKEAADAFAEATDNKDRRFFQGLAWKHLRRFDKAAEELERAKSEGYDPVSVEVELIEAQALGGELDGAAKTLAKAQGRLGGSADASYLAGLIEELRGNVERAIELYEKARATEENHPLATFRLAYCLDLHGEEGAAVELYQACLARPPVSAGALLNLAVLHEDAGRYDAAAACLRRLLAAIPGHARARLFLRDVEASRTMYFDEEQAKRLAKHNAVLDIPVTDFELSVRARNCLKKMNIRTLGDLVRTNEPQLLAYKNFGETSLKEIRDMLSAKGLRLGGAAEQPAGTEIPLLPQAPAAAEPAKNEGVLATPLESLDFSIRSRKAFELLKVHTLGDLAALSEPELLACRNFGQTSLIEVRQRLSEHGLSLREAT
jgi:DNA-directed RNA polymerase subunit alpha